MNLLITDEKIVIEDIRNLIKNAKTRVAVVINSQMTMLYWNIGKRIKEEIIKSNRAEYGKKVINILAQNLSAEFGNGFSKSYLLKMISFYEAFIEPEIVATLSRQLTWSHIVELLPLNKLEQRQFYAYMAAESGWSIRELRRNIQRTTYERTIVNQSSDVKRLKVNQISNEVMNASLLLKDPYVLDFLDLPDMHYENELEIAILREIEKFILELGTGFSFVARQKRITVDEDHFYLDILFYNRKIKRSVAIELKSGKFKPEYKGQMELYLKYLENMKHFQMNFLQ